MQARLNEDKKLVTELTTRYEKQKWAINEQMWISRTWHAKRQRPANLGTTWTQQVPNVLALLGSRRNRQIQAATTQGVQRAMRSNAQIQDCDGQEKLATHFTHRPHASLPRFTEPSTG